MTGALLAGITGLALLDALNPATIAGVALLLLAPIERPVAAAGAFVLGAYVAVWGLGAALYLGAEAAAEALNEGLALLRRLVFGVAAVALVVASIRRFTTRTRPAVRLPGWVRPATAAPFGLLLTGADLPNAFPYVIAIERLVNAQVATGPGLLVLAGYSLVYCLPCLILLALGISHGDRVRERLRAVYRRLGAERLVPRRPALALAYLGAAAAALAVAVGS